MLKGFIGLLLIFTMILMPATILLAGTLVEDFDDGDAEGWERSPQNENSKVFWGVMIRNVIITTLNFLDEF